MLPELHPLKYAAKEGLCSVKGSKNGDLGSPRLRSWSDDKCQEWFQEPADRSTLFEWISEIHPRV